MNWDYIRVSALMFLEFAVWGPWMPVLRPIARPIEDDGQTDGLDLWHVSAGVHVLAVRVGLFGRQILQRRMDHPGFHAVGILLLIWRPSKRSSSACWS